MAELLQVVEPTEKSYDIRLTESEVSLLTFLLDFTHQSAKVTYQSHANGRVYNSFGKEIEKKANSISNALVECAGYNHAQDYME